MPVLTKYQLRELRHHADGPKPVNVRTKTHRVIAALVDKRLLTYAGGTIKPTLTKINFRGRKALELLR